MKTACLLFTIVGFGALTLGASLADQPPEKGPDEKGEQTKSKNDNHAFEKISQTENQTTGDKPADHPRSKPERDEKELADGKHPKAKNDSRVSEKSSQAGPIKKAMPAHHPGQDRSKQVANNHGDAAEKRVDNHQNKPPAVNDFHQPALNRPSTVVKGGLVLNTIGNHREQPARLPPGGGTTALVPAVVPGRSATTAIIGGLAASSAKSSTAVIDGSGMKRKP